MQWPIWWQRHSMPLSSNSSQIHHTLNSSNSRCGSTMCDPSNMCHICVFVYLFHFVSQLVAICITNFILDSRGLQSVLDGYFTVCFWWCLTGLTGDSSIVVYWWIWCECIEEEKSQDIFFPKLNSLFVQYKRTVHNRLICICIYWLFIIINTNLNLKNSKNRRK